MSETLFKFKEFKVSQELCAMKINTDGVLLGAWVDCENVNSVLDVGTGSGVIAIMLAQRCEADRIEGIEIDKQSYEEASSNMAESPWKNRLSAICQSIQEYAEGAESDYDLIVSNPPFFSGGTLSSTQKRTLVKHTVKLPHSDLLRAAYKLLSKQGQFSVVLPYIEGLRFIELANQYRLYCSRKCEVSSFKDSPVERLLLTFEKEQKELVEESIYIRKNEKDYSEEYVALTRPFYLKM